MRDWLVSLEDVLAGVPDPSVGDPVNYPIQHGTMRVGIYAPRGTDPQQPHDQDEIYIVISGTGTFVKAGERRPFKAGDVIFVEAGIEHRFEDFGDDFATWVVFWGREGGEAGALSAAE